MEIYIGQVVAVSTATFDILLQVEIMGISSPIFLVLEYYITTISTIVLPVVCGGTTLPVQPGWLVD